MHHPCTDVIKKVTLEFEPEILALAGFEGVAAYIQRTEKLAELRSLQGRILFVMRVWVNDKICDPRELVDKFGVQEVHVLRAAHPEYLIFYRIQPNRFLTELLQQVDYDVYFTVPEYYDGERYVVAFYTHRATLIEILRILRNLGIRFKVRAITAPAFTGEYLFQEFSPKQLEVLVLAAKAGYYRVPRQTSAQRLASELGISVQMFHEHLRKAEQKLIAHLMEDSMDALEH